MPPPALERLLTRALCGRVDQIPENKLNQQFSGSSAI